MERRLYRSRRDRMLGGVAGGLGRYLGFDPVIARVLFIVLVLGTGVGVLLYLLLWIVIPLEPEGLASLEPGFESGGRHYRRLNAREQSLLIGGALIALGVILLAREFGLLWWVSLRRLWPLLLVAAGLALLVDRARSE